jgi:hypothetical protein
MTLDTNSSVDICALLAIYTTYSDNSLPMLQDNLLVLSSRVKNPKRRRRTDNSSQNIIKELPP